MKLFVAGVPCSGKTTLVRHLRERYGVTVIDLDDEILRLNGGTWPDIETKNTVVKPMALREVLAMGDIILFDSPMTADNMQQLREAGFRVVLIEVSKEELRRRDTRRHAEEGWTNIQWFDWNQVALREFSGGRLDRCCDFW